MYGWSLYNKSSELADVEPGTGGRVGQTGLQVDRLLQLGPGVLQVKLLCDVPVLSYFQSLSLLRLPLSPGVVSTFLGSIFFDIIKVQIVDFHTVHRTAKLFSQLIRNLVLADQTGLYFLHFLPDDCSECVGVQRQEGVVGVFLSYSEMDRNCSRLNS